MFFVFLGISTLLSYISVYQPLVLSRNITPIDHSITRVWVFTCILSLSIPWTWYGLMIAQYPSLLLFIHMVLIQIAFIDGYSKIIPNRLLLVLLILFMVDVSVGSSSVHLIFLLLFNCLLIAVQIIIKQFTTKNLMGWGDIKLLIVLSIVFQNKVLIILVGGLFLAGIYSMVLVMINSDSLKVKVPLAPFFVAIIPALSKFSMLVENLILNVV